MKINITEGEESVDNYRKPGNNIKVRESNDNDQVHPGYLDRQGGLLTSWQRSM